MKPATVKAVVLAAAVAMVLPLSLLAADRATFVLRSGERESGVIAAHGSGRNNLIDNQLNLDNVSGGTGNLSEKSYPIQDVVAIDFTGTPPSPQELSGLNGAGANNVLALRDGTVLYGKFDNIVGGDTVLFSENGQQRQFSTSQVARVYLDLQGARTAYNAPAAAPAPGQPAVGTSGQAGAISVDASRAWTDTGVTVTAGQQLTFQASGQILFGRQASLSSGPAGSTTFQGRHRPYPVPSAPVGALIGRVGNGQAFIIGANTQPITMPASGRLMLGVNDDQFADNSGTFQVTVTPQRH